MDDERGPERLEGISGDVVEVYATGHTDDDTPVYLTVLDADHDTIATAALTEDEADAVRAHLERVAAAARHARRNGG